MEPLVGETELNNVVVSVLFVVSMLDSTFALMRVQKGRGCRGQNVRLCGCYEIKEIGFSMSCLNRALYHETII
jgi:hypothetical protein